MSLALLLGAVEGRGHASDEAHQERRLIHFAQEHGYLAWPRFENLGVQQMRADLHAVHHVYNFLRRARLQDLSGAAQHGLVEVMRQLHERGERGGGPLELSFTAAELNPNPGQPQVEVRDLATILPDKKGQVEVTVWDESTAKLTAEYKDDSLIISIIDEQKHEMSVRPDPSLTAWDQVAVRVQLPSSERNPTDIFSRVMLRADVDGNCFVLGRRTNAITNQTDWVTARDTRVQILAEELTWAIELHSAATRRALNEAERADQLAEVLDGLVREELKPLVLMQSAIITMRDIKR